MRNNSSKKGEWEKKKIEETKNDGKSFWTMIKKLLEKIGRQKKIRMFIHKKKKEKRSWRCQQTMLINGNRPAFKKMKGQISHSGMGRKA